LEFTQILKTQKAVKNTFTEFSGTKWQSTMAVFDAKISVFDVKISSFPIPKEIFMVNDSWNSRSSLLWFNGLLRSTWPAENNHTKGENKSRESWRGWTNKQKRNDSEIGLFFIAALPTPKMFLHCHLPFFIHAYLFFIFLSQLKSSYGFPLNGEFFEQLQLSSIVFIRPCNNARTRWSRSFSRSFKLLLKDNYYRATFWMFTTFLFFLILPI